MVSYKQPKKYIRLSPYASLADQRAYAAEYFKNESNRMILDAL